GYWSTVNYREAYGLFATNGILYNHETLVASTPLIMRRFDGFVDVKPIAEIVQHDAGVSIDESRHEYQAGFPARNLEVWARDGWVSRKGREIKVTSASSEARDGAADLWRTVGGRGHSFNPSRSGFDSTRIVGQVLLTGVPDWFREIQLYNAELSPFGHRTK